MVWWTVFEPIKRKADCKVFREKVHATEDHGGGLRIRNDRGKVIEFIRTRDDWSVHEYSHMVGELGWVTVELANTANPAYEVSVDDLIWKYRKAINAYLNRE